jgi:hypothetical protein
MKHITIALLLWHACAIACHAAESRPAPICDVNPETDSLCYHVVHKAFCNYDSMRTICKEEFGIQEKDLKIYFSYRYYGYIKLSRENHIDVIVRDDELHNHGKALEKRLRDGLVILWDERYWEYADLDLPKERPLRYIVPPGHKTFRALLRKKLVDGSLGVVRFLLELCGETPDLKPVIKTELIRITESPANFKVYFDENGTEMPSVVLHLPGFGFFPEEQ